LRSERRPTRIEKLLAPLCRRLVAISVSGQRFFRRSLPGAGRKIEVIRDSFVRVEPERRGGGRCPRIGMASNLVRGKGQEHVIAAMAKIRRAFPDARLVIAGTDLGDKGYAEELRAQAEGLGLGDAVEFAGWVDDISAFLGGVDILVDASYLREGYRHTIVEGMQGGVPVIATDVGAVHEIIRSASEGVIVRPCDAGAIADAVLMLLEEPDRMERVARNGRAAVESRLCSDDGARRMEHLLQRVAAARRQ
jgi:glycosyltransferase involved in cell wall biosynthesis